MIRAAGVVFILTSAVIYLTAARSNRVKQELFVQDLLDAVESIETAIRWEKKTLPDSIAQQIPRKYAGGVFLKIAEKLESEMALQQAWSKAFFDISPAALSHILCAVTLAGDSAFLEKQLAFTAEQIKDFQRKEQEEKTEKQKLRTALAFSVAGLTIILLL